MVASPRNHKNFPVIAFLLNELLALVGNDSLTPATI